MFFRAITFIPLLFISIDISVMFVFAAIFECLTATFPVIANIVATHIGVRIIGLTLVCCSEAFAGAAIGVVFGGLMFDLTAKYEFVWWLSAGLAAMAGVFAIFVKETRLPPVKDALTDA